MRRTRPLLLPRLAATVCAATLFAAAASPAVVEDTIAQRVAACSACHGAQGRDADAIYAYLRSLPPVVQANRAHALRFPFDSQAALALSELTPLDVARCRTGSGD